MKLVDSQYNDVAIAAMQDGDIAIITKWSDSQYVGRIVQRYDMHLVTLGQPSGQSWTNFRSLAASDQVRVRILPPGTKLEI
jgi:hypothetical protein